MKIIDFQAYHGKRFRRGAGMAAMSLLYPEQLDNVAENILRSIESNAQTPRGTPEFFRAVKREARRVSPELREALYRVLVIR